MLLRHCSALVRACVCLIFASMCSGCSTPPAGDIIVAIDRSASMDDERGQQWDFFDELVNYATATCCQMYVWAFDRTPVEVWGPNVPHGVAGFNVLKGDDLKARRGIRMTRPAALLEILAPEIESAGRPIFVCLLTDGDSEIPSDLPRLRAIGARLADTPKLHISVVGIKPENRSVWAEAFRPMGSRFRMAGWSEGDQEFWKIRRDIERWHSDLPPSGEGSR